MPPEDEDDIFAREMAGVRRMRLEPRVRVRRANAQTADTLAQRRIAAVAVAADDCDGLSASHVEWVEPTDVLTWRGDGVAHGVFKRLKQGGYALDARLDLHKHTVEQARKAIVRFILDCQKYDVRSALILHGKGERGEQQAVIKSYTQHWLKLTPEVMAFHSAQPHHGGAGALYVLIKKSDKLKQDNRERYRGQ